MEVDKEISINDVLDSLENQLKNINLENADKDIEELEDIIDEDIAIINEANSLLRKENVLKEKERIKKTRYTLEEKIAVLNLLKFNVSKHSIERDYGIDRKTIRSWEDKKEEIMIAPNKKGFRLWGGGRKPITKDIEADILIWINTCRRNSIASCNQIIACGIKLNGGDFKLSYNEYKCWVHLFLIRHKLSIRKASHIGQCLPKQYENIIYKFLLECIKKKRETKIDDDTDCIINIDETLCYLENPSKETVDIKGKKK